MRRRDFIVAFGGAAVWPLATQSQQPQLIRHIANRTAPGNGRGCERWFLSARSDDGELLPAFGALPNQLPRRDTVGGGATPVLKRSRTGKLMAVIPRHLRPQCSPSDHPANFHFLPAAISP